MHSRLAVALALGAALAVVPRAAGAGSRLFFGVGPAWSHSSGSRELVAGAGVSADFGPGTPLAYTVRADYSGFRESAAGGALLTFGFKFRRTQGVVRPYVEAGFGVVGFGEALGVGPAAGGGIHIAPPRGPGCFIHVHAGHGAFIESEGSVVLVRAGVATR